MTSYPAIEGDGDRRGPAAWLRAKRFHIALLVGLAETLVILLTDATWRWALVLAAAVFLFHIFVGRKSRHDLVRQLSWAAAGSQLLPVLIPVIALAAQVLAVVAVIVLAVVVFAMLLLDRR